MVSSNRPATLFEAARLQMPEAIERTAENLREYGATYSHWVIAYSGGKDSSTLVTVVVWLIESGQVPRPRRLTVLYADTRLELPPLAVSAEEIMGEVRDAGWEAERVMAPLDKRFLVYLLGRGVPPPNNNTLRWCTRQIKIDPMARRMEELRSPGEKLLVLTGVRRGESAMRDRRIALSCARNGAECGQGWFQETLPGALADTLAPIDHWRICHVWEWLTHWAPLPAFGDWSTRQIAAAYGGRDGDEAAELEARTGCIGCPLAQQDLALEGMLRLPGWDHFRPLLELRPTWRELRRPRRRLRQPGGETRADGSLSTNQNRMGPLTLAARAWALERVLSIQRAVNDAASILGRPGIDLLSNEEEARVRDLIALGTWPEGWTGTEPVADLPFDAHFPNGDEQPLLTGLF